MDDDTRRRRSRRLRTIGGSTVAVVALLAALAGPASASTPADRVLLTGLPNKTLTPGATNPEVTQATIRQTICLPGWTATIRPSSSYTSRLKIRQLEIYGYLDRHLADYEEDHLISLELGGAPRDPRNLWPEPRHIRLADGTDVGGYAKDALENSLKRRVCAGTLSLISAQHEIARNWVKYWTLMKAGASAHADTDTDAHAHADRRTALSGRGRGRDGRRGDRGLQRWHLVLQRDAIRDVLVARRRLLVDWQPRSAGSGLNPGQARWASAGRDRLVHRGQPVGARQLAIPEGRVLPGPLERAHVHVDHAEPPVVAP